jgi:long-subunit acyl-CoA synthetase (AMP-forming)
MFDFQQEIDDLIKRYEYKQDFVYHTSGSTGKPKEIVLPYETMKMCVEENIRIMKINSNSIIVNLCIPPTSIAFSCFTTLTALVTGAKLITKKFKANTYVDDLQNFKGTHHFIIPAVYRILSKTRKWKDLDLSSYEVMMTGSDLAPEGIKQDLLSKGATRFLNIYGSTEVPPAISESETERDITNVSPLIDYKIADDGELFIKWQCQDEYWASGDLFEKIDNGFKMIGRKKNILRLNCAHVQPELIEQYIMNRTKVDRALVTRSKNDKIGVYFEGPETKQTEVFTALNTFYGSGDNIVDFVKWVSKIETNHLNKVIRHQSL